MKPPPPPAIIDCVKYVVDGVLPAPPFPAPVLLAVPFPPTEEAPPPPPPLYCEEVDPLPPA